MKNDIHKYRKIITILLRTDLFVPEYKSSLHKYLPGKAFAESVFEFVVGGFE